MTNIHTKHKSADQPEGQGHDRGSFFNPESGAGNGGNVPPHAPNNYGETPQPEHRPWFKRWPVVAGTGALALAVVAGAGAAVGAKMGGGDSNEHKSGPQPTTGQSLEPTPTPTPSPSVETSTPPTPTETIKIPEVDDSAAIEYKRGLDIKVFNDLPRIERLKYVAWAAIRVDQGDYYDFYSAPDQAFIAPNPAQSYPGEFLYDKNPYNSVFPNKGASKFDDGQKIMDQALFWDQLYRAQAASKSDLAGKLNKNEALKMMSARSYYVDNKHPEQTAGTYDEQAHFIQQSINTSHLSVAERYIATDTSRTLLAGEDVEGNPIQYKDVTYVNHGHTYVGRFVFETVPVKITDTQTNEVKTVDVNMWVTYSDTQK